ncbi:MAG: hypothetical protein JWM87_766 [Candidatus Eremiobacteraeota bacterium]|nr:hypothetical protein [Candidatus Eremiobacteraeota bacterium]
MTFEAWTHALVAALRAKLDVRATRRGKTVVLRYGAAEIIVEDEPAHVVIRIGDRVAFTPERTAETARVIADSLAAHFDVGRFGRG